MTPALSSLKTKGWTIPLLQIQEITVNMVNGRKFLDGPIDSLVITSTGK